MGGASAQIERVIDTAERAAADIRAGAEAHAQRELEEARRQIDAMTRDRVAMVSQLTEALIEHATLVATQCEGLIRTLEATMQRLAAPAPQPTPPPEVETAQPPAVEQAPQPAPAPATATAYPAQPSAEPQPQPAPQAPPAFAPPPAQAPPPQPTQPAQPPRQPWPGQGDPQPVPPPQAGPPAPEAPSAPVPPLGAPIDQRVPAPSAPEPPPTPQAPGPTTAPQPATPPPAPQPPTPGGVPDDAYLRATRLALDGRDRSEIAAQLSAEFGIADPEPVLNRVLGAA